jgi:hypothetical protein
MLTNRQALRHNGLRKKFQPTPACKDERYASDRRPMGHSWLSVCPQIGEVSRQSCPHCGLNRILWGDGSEEFRRFDPATAAYSSE